MYCPSCGATNSDGEQFCGACGTQLRAPAAAPPPAGQVAAYPAAKSGNLLAKVLLIVIPLVLIGVAGLVAWMLFFKPLSPGDYEIAVEDGFEEIVEGTRVMGEAVKDLVADSQGGISSSDLSQYKDDFAGGERMVRSACQTLAGLRAPDEYARLHRDVEKYTGFMLTDVVDPMAAFMKDVSAGDDGSAVGRKLTRATERSTHNAESARRSLDAVYDALYLDSLGDPLKGLALSPLTVTISWDRPVDVDLRIYDASGNESYSHLKDRDATGGSGDQSETIEFKDHGTEDLSQGRYKVTAYYASRGDTSDDQVLVRVVMTLPSGEVVERQQWVDWTVSSDEWHIFEFDAATGEYTELGWLD